MDHQGKINMIFNHPTINLLWNLLQTCFNNLTLGYYSSVTLFLLSFCVFNNVSEATMAPLSQRKMGFEDFNKNVKLSNSLIRTYWNTPKLKCAKMCSKTPNCLSFNICGRKNCELSSLDVHMKNFTLEENEDCNYFGMNQIEVPTCREKGVYKSIRNDDKSQQNICQINSKRIDGEWEVNMDNPQNMIDNSTSWERIVLGDCSGSAREKLRLSGSKLFVNT